MIFLSQPLCEGCWQIRHGERRPLRLKNREPEICCDCGRMTTAGIYMRLDADKVRYPTIREEVP